MTPLRPSRNSFHNILQKVSTAPVGTPSERVKLRPRLCAALNMAKYARKMNDDPSIRKTWSPFFSLRGATAVDMGFCVCMASPSPYHPMPGAESLLGDGCGGWSVSFVRAKQQRPSSEGRPKVGVSKDGRGQGRARGHPSRRALKRAPRTKVKTKFPLGSTMENRLSSAVVGPAGGQQG